MNPVQLTKLSIIYDAVAKLLPTEGRDYTTEVKFDEGDQPKVKILGITEMGNVFATHCRDNILNAIEEVKEERNGNRPEPVESGDSGVPGEIGTVQPGVPGDGDVRQPGVPIEAGSGSGSGGAAGLIADVRRAVASGTVGGDGDTPAPEAGQGDAATPDGDPDGDSAQYVL